MFQSLIFHLKSSIVEKKLRSENNMIMVNITGNTMDVYLGKENAF